MFFFFCLFVNIILVPLFFGFIVSCCVQCVQQFEVEDSESLCQCLKSLATDGNKHRAKNDRRKQRSIFREVLHYIEV